MQSMFFIWLFLALFIGFLIGAPLASGLVVYKNTNSKTLGVGMILASFVSEAMGYCALFFHVSLALNFSLLPLLGLTLVLSVPPAVSFEIYRKTQSKMAALGFLGFSFLLEFFGFMMPIFLFVLVLLALVPG